MNTRPKILCVDDEPVNLRLLEAVLRPRGYEVIEASDGTEARIRIDSWAWPRVAEERNRGWCLAVPLSRETSRQRQA